MALLQDRAFNNQFLTSPKPLLFILGNYAPRSASYTVNQPQAPMECEARVSARRRVAAQSSEGVFALTPDNAGEDTVQNTARSTTAG